MEAIESVEIGGFTASLHYDECPGSPRAECNVWVWYGERRGTLDETIPRYHDDCWTDGEWIDSIRSPGDSVALLRYTHNGIERVDDPSRADALAVLSADALDDECGGDRAAAYRYLDGEVATFDAYLRGEVYYWQVTDGTGAVVDSCGGYVGETDYPMSEAIDAAKHLADERNRQTLCMIGGNAGAIA